MLKTPFKIPNKKIQSLCEKWKITTFELFGSVLRKKDFSQKSDIDVMISFEQGATPGLDFIEIKNELESIFGRPVDIVTRKTIEQSQNPFRKNTILATTQTIYEKKSTR